MATQGGGAGAIGQKVAAFALLALASIDLVDGNRSRPRSERDHGRSNSPLKRRLPRAWKSSPHHARRRALRSPPPASSSPTRGGQGPRRQLYVDHAEADLVRGSQEYLEALGKLGVADSIDLVITLTGTKGLFMTHGCGWHDRAPVAALAAVVLFELALLAVAFLDVSTHAFLHVRRVIHRGAGYEVLDERPSPTGIGLAQRRESEGGGYYFVSNVLTLRSRVELERAGLSMQVPSARLFAAAHVLNDLPGEAARLAAAGGFESSHSLALSREDEGRTEAQPFLNAAAPPFPIPGRVEERRRTYNQVRLQVLASQPALLFLGHSYSPYWTARMRWPRTWPAGRWRATSPCPAGVVPTNTPSGTAR